MPDLKELGQRALAAGLTWQEGMQAVPHEPGRFWFFGGAQKYGSNCFQIIAPHEVSMRFTLENLPEGVVPDLSTPAVQAYAWTLLRVRHGENLTSHDAEGRVIIIQRWSALILASADTLPEALVKALEVPLESY